MALLRCVHTVRKADSVKGLASPFCCSIILNNALIAHSIVIIECSSRNSGAVDSMGLII